MKFLSLFKDLFGALVIRPLLRDPFRAAIAVFGVAVGVSVFLSIQLANRQTLASFKESVDLVAGRADAVVHAEGLAFDEKYFADLLPLREWVKVYPVIEGYGVEPETGETVEILGVDLLQDTGIRDFSLKTAGQDLKGFIPLVLDPAGVILPEKFIPGTDFKPGDKIRLAINGSERLLNVNAILESKGLAKALNGNFALMDIAAAQLAFGKIGKLDRIDAAFLQDRGFDRMRSRISQALPDFLRIDRPQRKNQQVEKMLKAFQYNLSALGFVALLVALYLIYNMVALSVVRRRSEIGVLRAMGAGRGLVAAIFFMEAGVVGAAGSLLGIGLGYYFARFALEAVAVTVNNLYVPANVTEPPFHWTQAGPYFFLGLGLSFLSALVPAYDAATTPPTLVMRRGSYDLKIYRGNRRLTVAGLSTVLLAAIFCQFPPIGRFPYFGFFSVFLLILGFSLLAPSILLAARDRLRGACKKLFGGEGLVACMNLAQNVGRNSISVSSLAIAFMMAISMGVMVHSFRQTVVVWIGQTLRADLFVRAAGGARIDYQYALPESSAAGLRELPGVAGVDLFRAVEISYGDEPAILASGDFKTLSQYGDLAIKSGPPARELDRWMAGKNRALVSEPFSLKHRKNPGDRLLLDTPNGKLDLEIAGVYYDYSQERGYIVLDRTTYTEYYNDSRINSFAVYLDDRRRLNDVRGEIARTVGRDHKILVRSNAELKKEVLEIFDKTFAITYSLEIIAIGVAVLGLFNTLVSLVLERKREIGILRFAGAFAEQVKRIVLIEAGILGLVGLAIGLTAGVAVSYILIFVINKQSFGWTIQVHFPYAYIAGATALFWLASFLAGWYPARLAARMEPAKSVRAE